jgi:two-component sensor histidine kinase
MGEAHALLSRSRWQSVSLADLIAQELAPYVSTGNTVVEGPYIGLTAAGTQAISMVLHELATNAAKYGALSTPQGRVSVRWDVRSNGVMPSTARLEWNEQGGPAVTVPAQTGYGTSVIRNLIPYELGGTVDHVLAPGGVYCTIAIPAEHATSQDQTSASRPDLASVLS